MAETTIDKDFAIEKLIFAAQEMDEVIKDLSQILDAKHYVGEHVEVDLDQMLARVRNLLESEMDSTGAIMTTDFSTVNSIVPSVPDHLVIDSELSLPAT